MAYLSNGTGNGSLYIGNVKWNNEYKHVMMFSSLARRNSFLTEHLTKISGSVVFINPNSYVDINAKIEGCENLNYCFYTNDSGISDTHYCCFITNFEYLTPHTTRLYLELDVFQQYYYQTNFYTSFIERAIVKKSTDTLGAYTQNEPFSVKLEYESKIKDILTSAQWNPQWVLHCASKKKSLADEYEYTGIGTDNTFGEYGFYIDSVSDMTKYLELYGRLSMNQILDSINAPSFDWKDFLKNILITQVPGVGAVETLQSIMAVINSGVLQDHRDELIGLYAIPKWGRQSGDNATNERISTTETVTLNTNTLANGYTNIKNKKLLSSVCRAFLLVNRNGYRLALKPELFTGTSTTITLYCIPMATSGYQFHISGYKDYNKSYGEIPYSSERRVGYDQNTGLNKILNGVGAFSGLAGSAMNIAGNVVSGNAVGAVMGLPDLVNTGVNAVDMLGAQGASFGNNGDLLRVTDGFSQLRFYELNPSVNECRAIDDFFSTYGYTINELDNFASSDSPFYFNSRSNWNFIKTANCNCNCNCPSEYENRFKDIFNNGVTLWHTYSGFCDYSANNT